MNVWTIPLDNQTYLVWVEDNIIKNRALTRKEHDFLFKHKDLKPILEELVKGSIECQM